ncbi:MAG: Rab family GTPase [Candidatus Jordarchaeum sp.]|uniref:Rab family GTPase n=1 Tax=Candidatus Jordarchaeum sp. TaxID=2823881 RepID=UPI00404B6D17
MSIPTYTYKIVCVGNGAVGKTSLIKSYTENTFSENYLTTVGANFATNRIFINGVQITSQFWDLGGQPQFKIVRQNFYHGAKGVVYVFDVTKRVTFESLDKWRAEVTEILPVAPCIVIGNKIDLPRNVNEDEAREYAYSINAQYFEASVLKNINVQESMTRINEIIFEKQESVTKSLYLDKVSSYSEDWIRPKNQDPMTPSPSKSLFSEDHFPLLYKT